MVKLCRVAKGHIMKLRQFLLLVAGAAALTGNADYSLAQAQDWPMRPVTLIVPTAAGGGADILGRILTGRLSEVLGQPVIVENVGNGVAATARVAKAVPDGYHFISRRPVPNRFPSDHLQNASLQFAYGFRASRNDCRAALSAGDSHRFPSE